MKILIIAADFPPWDGGIAHVAYEYARHFSLLDHQVTVLAPKYENTQEWDRQQLFEIHRYRSHKAFVMHYWLLRFKLSALTGRANYDWILCMRWNFDGISLMPVLKKNPVIFQWYHGAELFDRHLADTKWLKKLNRLMENVSANISVSDYTAGLLSEHFPDCKRKHTVHLGVDTNRFIAPESTEKAKAALGLAGKKVILTLARMVRRKGQELTIKSLRHFKKTSDVVYVIGGKGAYETELRQLAQQLKVMDQVRFEGFVPEEQKVAYYQACDIFVMPSRSEENIGDVEGFGLTYLEANACGKPVIGGNQGGCIEAVENGVSGFLVDPDSPVELAQMIQRLLNDRNLYQALSIAGRKRAVKDFSWQASCRKLESVYRACRQKPNGL
ncbi:MAG: glycosyltransferase family 4 protein [Desulfobacteraceae bacterium]|nr:glycosyltransferase family 4 protein [Desulfobacteraceae bacterium]